MEGTVQDQAAAPVAVQEAATAVVPAVVTAVGRVAATLAVPAAAPVVVLLAVQVAGVDAAHPGRHLIPQAAAPLRADLTRGFSERMEIALLYPALCLRT